MGLKTKFTDIKHDKAGGLDVLLGSRQRHAATDGSPAGAETKKETGASASTKGLGPREGLYGCFGPEEHQEK